MISPAPSVSQSNFFEHPADLLLVERNCGTKRYIERDMDSSLRVSSASTETAVTAAITLVSINTSLSGTEEHMMNSHNMTETTASSGASPTANSSTSPTGLQVEVNSQQVRQEAPGLTRAPSMIIDVDELSQQRASTRSLNTASTGMSDSFSQLGMTTSMQQQPQAWPMQRASNSVARMPTTTNQSEFDTQILHMIDNGDHNDHPTTSNSNWKEEDLDKKPAAKPKPSLITSNNGAKRSPSRSPRQSVTFAALPPNNDDSTGIAQTPDLYEEEADKKMSASTNTNSLARPAALRICDRAKSDGSGTSSTAIPTPRARGLRGRRTPQDRDNRRRQIMANTRPGSNSPQRSATAELPARAREPSAPTTNSPRRSPPPTVRTPFQVPNNTQAPRPLPGDSLLGAPAALAEPSIAPAMAPGDNLASANPNRPAANRAAPGDNLANRSPDSFQRPVVTTRRIVRPLILNNANPPSSAYAEGAVTDQDHSEKQRARRQNLNNDTNSNNGDNSNSSAAPSSIRPGAYKEIPGRGLVRNNTLRFTILTSIQNKKRSLRNMFARASSSRRGTFPNASTRSNRHLTSNRHLQGDQLQSNDGPIHALLADGNDSGISSLARSGHDSGFSACSIPSVLVEEREKGNVSRSYLGALSMRSLNGAQETGLSVARPVFQRESSTMEALCIIPGDLAVAVALDEQIKRQSQSNARGRLEALSSGAGMTATIDEGDEPPVRPTPKQLNKARRMLKKVVKSPMRLLKKTNKTLSRRNLNKVFRRKKTRRSNPIPEIHQSRSVAFGPLQIQEETSLELQEETAGGNYVRRHSF